MISYPSTKVKPYVYIGIHKTTREFYIGYREANTTPSHIDLYEYRTSSKIVNPTFDNYSWRILVEFNTGEDAYDFEQQLIFENWTDPLLINESCHYGRARFKSDNAGKSKSELHKEKLKIARRLRQPHSEETKRKISVGNLGKVVPKESRQRIADAKTGSNNPMFGKSVTDEVRQLKRVALQKYNQNLIEQNIPHPSIGFVQARVSCCWCKKEVAVNIFSRFHGNNCKQRKENA
jgi:hypothetical protein